MTSPSQPLNLHHFSEVDDLAARLAFEDPSETIVLSGEPGSGRRYLMRAAASEARKRGVDVWLSAIDLDGYEPEQETLDPYVRFQLDKRGRGLDGIGLEESVRRIVAVPGADPLDRALAAALILGRDEASDDLVEPLLQGGRPALFSGEQASRRLALHVADVTEISVVVRERLFAWAEAEPRLRPALSCSAWEGQAVVGPGREVARFELQRLEPGELQGLADLNGGLSVTPEEAGRIHELSGGLPGVAARALDSGDPWRDPLDALAAAPEAERDRIRTLLHLGALCGENIPVRALAEFLGVGEDAQEEFIDLLDETVGADAERPLFAPRFQHPSFPAEQIYGFDDPLVPAFLLGRLPPDSRRRLAAELSGFLLRAAPPLTRAGTRLLLNLTMHAQSVPYRREFRRELACWVGEMEVEELTAILTMEAREEFRDPADVWTTIYNVQPRWPAWRTLAMLEAVRPDALPPQLGSSHSLVRSGLLLDLKRNDEALAEAEAGRDDCEDPLVEAALLDRIAVAQQRLSREQEATASRAQSLEKCEALLEQGDQRVVPWMRERIAALRRAGEDHEADALQAKLDKAPVKA